MDENSSNPSHLGKENPVDGNVSSPSHLLKEIPVEGNASSPSHLSKEIPTDGKNNELYQQTGQRIPAEDVVKPSIPPLSKCWADQANEEDSQDPSLEIQVNVKIKKKPRNGRKSQKGRNILKSGSQ